MIRSILTFIIALPAFTLLGFIGGAFIGLPLIGAIGGILAAIIISLYRGDES